MLLLPSSLVSPSSYSLLLLPLPSLPAPPFPSLPVLPFPFLSDYSLRPSFILPLFLFHSSLFPLPFFLFRFPSCQPLHFLFCTTLILSFLFLTPYLFWLSSSLNLSVSFLLFLFFFIVLIILPILLSMLPYCPPLLFLSLPLCMPFPHYSPFLIPPFLLLFIPSSFSFSFSLFLFPLSRPTVVVPQGKCARRGKGEEGRGIRGGSEGRGGGKAGREGLIQVNTASLHIPLHLMFVSN